MIVAEREPVICKDYTLTIEKEDFAMHFGEAMPDGRLTENSNGKNFRLREAILQSKRLGRPLTEEEMAQFEVKE